MPTPITFHLHGKCASIANQPIPHLGMQLSDDVWQIVKQDNLKTTGISHWIYFPNGRMAVAIELTDKSQSPAQLEPIDIQLTRYIKRIHKGPYRNLPAVWNDLKTDLAAKGETISAPSLEIYGHHCSDESQLETTVIIGLE